MQLVLFPEEKQVPSKLTHIITWEDAKPVHQEKHETVFCDIINKHGFGNVKLIVPLIGRYSKPRKWSIQEFESAFFSWMNGTSLTCIAAALNRNPQDMIYKILKRCKSDGIKFSQRGKSEGSKNWTKQVAQCAAELFEAGLPAWRIAALFRVDFEHVEKELFLGRADYGHNKKNPFAICTDHKHFLNSSVIASSLVLIRSALDAFAGEGYFASSVKGKWGDAEIIAIEQDIGVFERGTKRASGENIRWINDNNLNVILGLISQGKRFDAVDLDPFVTCHQYLDSIWSLLEQRSLLFLTFGGEYRRSFIISNRKAIANRYGFANFHIPNKEYFSIVPYYFLGWVAYKAAQHGFVFEIIRAVRYPNNCRFWLHVEYVGERSLDWLSSQTLFNDGGCLWTKSVIPYFREVRYEFDATLK